MTDDTRPDPDVDPWVIPLHGPAFPAASADAGAPPILGVGGPGADGSTPPPLSASPLDGYTGPILSVPEDEDDIPYVGFHPRLRRSA